VPKNGKKIRIWIDSIMGDPPLEHQQDLLCLKDWMDSQNIVILSDISVWGEDRLQSWQGWEVPNRPASLDRHWCDLKRYLQGKAPLKKKGKDERGCGRNARSYTTTEGYQLFNSVPTAMPNLTLWKAIWKPRSLPKINLIIWTLVQKSIQIGENLRRRG
jgi:hypothetical protein